MDSLTDGTAIAYYDMTTVDDSSTSDLLCVIGVHRFRQR